MSSFFLVLSLTLQAGHGRSPLATGLAVTPWPIGLGITATVAARTAATVGRRLVTLGTLLLTAGMVLPIGAAPTSGPRLRRRPGADLGDAAGAFALGLSSASPCRAGPAATRRPSRSWPERGARLLQVAGQPDVDQLAPGADPELAEHAA